MKTYKVSIARIEHYVHQIDIEANDQDEAAEVAKLIWAEDEWKFRSLGCVHRDDFVNDIEEVMP